MLSFISAGLVPAFFLVYCLQNLDILLGKSAVMVTELYIKGAIYPFLNRTLLAQGLSLLFLVYCLQNLAILLGKSTVKVR